MTSTKAVDAAMDDKRTYCATLQATAEKKMHQFKMNLQLHHEEQLQAMHTTMLGEKQTKQAHIDTAVDAAVQALQHQHGQELKELKASICRYASNEKQMKVQLQEGKENNTFLQEEIVQINTFATDIDTSNEEEICTLKEQIETMAVQLEQVVQSATAHDLERVHSLELLQSTFFVVFLVLTVHTLIVDF